MSREEERKISMENALTLATWAVAITFVAAIASCEIGRSWERSAHEYYTKPAPQQEAPR